METAMDSIQSGLEQAVKYRVENTLASFNQWIQDHWKELHMKTEEMQLSLQAVSTSHDTWAKSLCEEIRDRRSAFTKSATSGSKERGSR
jgi:hypothetical protein